MPVDLNLGIPNASDSGVPVDCGDCGAHFMLDPSGDVAGAACSACGGTRFFRSQPSATQSDGTLRNMVDSDTQHDQGGNPLGEGTIVGRDGERPEGKRDNYMHSKVAYPVDEPPMMYEPMSGSIPEGVSLQDWRHNPGRKVCPICGADYSQDPMGYSHHVMEAHPGFGVNNGGLTVAKRVETMRTLNMEPYPHLWEKIAGPAALAPVAIEAAPEVGAAAAAAAPEVAGLAEGAAGAAGGLLGDIGSAAGNLIGDIGGVGGAAKKLLPKAIGPIMKGVMGGGAGGGQAGASAPIIPTPAPSMEAFGSTNIPFLLMADLETPHSIKSVDEQNDNPEHQDQKEFNDGDKDPSNFHNPNNQDTGANGEDGVKDATPGYGLGEGSPSLERAEMILPLLLHYFNSEESGQNDPLIRALHEALEQEQPGYMDSDDPEGHQAVQILLQHHGNPHQGGVNMAMPGGNLAPGDGLPQGGGGMCPNCGGVLSADGTCPQCGHKSGTQFGAQAPAAGGEMNISYPPNRVGTSQVGPQTPEQKAAVIQLLEKQGRHAEIPQVELEPWKFARELAEIQQEPNVAPLVDPNQAPPQAPPPQGMMNPGGGMPVNDPTQMGGGGMPMQPMSHAADANNAVPRCPNCNSATTGVHDVGDNTGDGSSNDTGYCHSCGQTFKIARRVFLTDLMNPSLQQTTDQMGHHDNNTLTWKDAQGQPLMVGQTYEMHTAGVTIPDEVKVVSSKPDEIGLSLVGDIAGIQANHNDSPDFVIHASNAEKYTFVPTGMPGSDNPQGDAKGGMPGMEQIPQAPQTTDEATNSYPNRGTMSSVLASDGDHDDLCHKCGGNWIDHIASSPTTTMHECARCGSVWESKNEFEGREANTDLQWLMEGGSESFANEMAAFQERRGGPSRNLAEVAARDSRYQAVSQVLSQNKMSREAGRHFTPGEQRQLINEKGKARNLNQLSIEDTHYATQYLPPTANEMNAPDEHLILGL